MKNNRPAGKTMRKSWIAQWLNLLIVKNGKDQFWKRPKNSWHKTANDMAHERGFVTPSLTVPGDWDVTPAGAKYLADAIEKANSK